jgi:hypothetical protein
MTASLSEACQEFVDALDEIPADGEPPARLRPLITRLAKDAVEHVAEHRHGEISALLQRSYLALAALSAEIENPDDRQCRYRRQAALLDLVILVDAVTRFHAATRAQQRASVDALRDLVAAALSDLVEPAE